MVMTSFKNQSELMQNPLDFSIDLGKGSELFRSYYELFNQFDFGSYLLNSFFISVITVLITLTFAIPGRLCRGAATVRGSRVLALDPVDLYGADDVLALPIYIAFSATGLRNTFIGIVMIYPVTTIPVALYMLQGISVAYRQRSKKPD